MKCVGHVGPIIFYKGTGKTKFLLYLNVTRSVKLFTKLNVLHKICFFYLSYSYKFINL
jgi:hypothetical protein